MGHMPSVFTSIGEDPGLSPKQRRERARMDALVRSRAAARSRLERIEAKLRVANGPTRKKLEEKALACLEEINEANERLAISEGVALEN
jgi:hypothetical protein